MMNFLGFSFVFIFVAAGAMITLAIWVWGIVDCIGSDKSTIDKLLWILILLVFNFIGAIVYFLAKGNVNIANKSKKRLEKSSDNKVVAGVCGGIAEYFGIDATIVRLGWVLLTIFSFGTGILLYIIAAIIMPGKGKKAKKEGGSSATIVVSVAAVLIVFILSILAMAMFTISQYSRGSSVARQISVENAAERAEKIAMDHIMMHPNYKENLGHDLSCYKVEKKDGRECSGYKDPYVARAFDDCYSVRCKFDSSSIETHGFTVEALVKETGIKRMSFEEVPRPIIEKEDIKSSKECEDLGYEIIYPELKGGPLKCDTPDGIINISSETPCIDKCGDGICQEIVCMGEGCPCAENKDNCAADC